EGERPIELEAIALLAPLRMVEVLRAARRVDAGRLDVAVGIRADPHLGPRGRDHERLDALPQRGIRDRLSPLVEVREPAPATHPTDAPAPGVRALQPHHGATLRAPHPEPLPLARSPSGRQPLLCRGFGGPPWFRRARSAETAADQDRRARASPTGTPTEMSNARSRSRLMPVAYDQRRNAVTQRRMASSRSFSSYTTCSALRP